MIIDARTLPADTVINADLCIIGAGPAGISIAREFDGLPLRVALLEAGGLEFETADQAMYEGETIGLPYDRLDQMRSRYFGGSSNCWGGFSRPMEDHDFEVRDWVPNSGWPFGRDEMMRWYRGAHALLELGPFDYESDLWEQRLGRPDARCVQFDRKRMVNLIAQLSPPTRFGMIYRDGIAKSDNVTAYLNANVTEIETPGNGSRVTGLQVRTRAGGTFRVVAKRYVLATGGIEAARLMLCSDRYQAGGVGNTNDVVGRYFMDHPRLRAGEIKFRDPAANSRIYDLHVIFPGGMTVDGVRVCAFFGLTPEAQERERVSNTRCYVASEFVGHNSESYEALRLVYEALHNNRRLRGRYLEVAGRLIRNTPNVFVLAVGLKFMPRFLLRGFALETVVEPTPLPDSRVTLGTERDALGMRRVRVDWRLGELEKRTMRRTQEILGEELELAGSGSVVVDAPREGEPWPKSPSWCWHHMGTTRMHTDPRRGVVDANSRVHGMANLFIAGSAVLPTVGCDMPTITIVALALRLANHLRTTFRSEAVSAAPAARETADAGAGSARD